MIIVSLLPNGLRRMSKPNHPDHVELMEVESAREHARTGGNNRQSERGGGGESQSRPSRKAYMGAAEAHVVSAARRRRRCNIVI